MEATMIEVDMATESLAVSEEAAFLAELAGSIEVEVVDEAMDEEEVVAGTGRVGVGGMVW
jgi:hypothetical protein